MGTMIQSHRLDTHQYHGDLFHDHACDQKGNNDLLTLTQPQIIRTIHTGYLEAGADILETNTFNSTRISMADYGMEDAVPELNLQGARLARDAGRRVDEAHAAAAALRGRRAGADQSHGVDLSGRERPRRAQRQLRRAGGRLPRSGGWPGAGRRRPAAGRDHLRHAQRQGCDLRHRGLVRAAWRLAAGDDLGDDHGSLRSHAVRPDRGRVLELGVARPAVLGGPELRAGREGPAPAHRGAGCQRRYPHFPAPECRPAQRDGRVRRVPGIHGERAARVCAGRLPQHRGRLLRNDAGAHPRHRGSGAGLRTPAGAQAGQAAALVRAGAADHRRGLPVRQRGRAHQRYRLEGVRAADSERQLCASAGGRPPAGGKRRADHRCEHGRGHARFAAGHGHVPEAGRFRAGHLARADHDRLEQVERDRGRLEVRAGQVGGQLDQPEGGRRAVPAPGQAGAPLRRRRSRHGVRRAGTGRHARSAASRSVPVPTICSPRKRAFRPRTSSSTPTSSRWPPGSKSTIATRSTSSRPPAGSSARCRMPA